MSKFDEGLPLLIYCNWSILDIKRGGVLWQNVYCVAIKMHRMSIQKVVMFVNIVWEVISHALIVEGSFQEKQGILEQDFVLNVPITIK